ncbi:helix-turn-helix transcriptional regulator [Streptomyces sp. 21So2-11]|uniref:helix-turn-helix domain-containing protein n=1 Tax=Streptomyces sp. 21So2-11 TaxID=3144408 RepID=UPI00321A825F
MGTRKDTDTEAFAQRLHEIREGSGRSYGALARRVGVSASTLHRYCSGHAVPMEFAPVERLARLCGCKGEDLIALHRLWVMADTQRRRRQEAAADAAAGRGAAAMTGPAPTPVPATPEAVDDVRPIEEPVGDDTTATVHEVTPVGDHVVPTVTPWHRRRATYASAALVAVVVTLALAAFVDSPGSKPDRRSNAVRDAGGTATESATPKSKRSGSASPSASPKPTASGGKAAKHPGAAGKGPGPKASASAGRSGDAPSAPRQGGAAWTCTRTSSPSSTAAPSWTPQRRRRTTSTRRASP